MFYSVISGADLTRNPKYNKGLAFTETERDRLYLRGLLPPAILSQDVQVGTIADNVMLIPITEQLRARTGGAVDMHHAKA